MIDELPLSDELDRKAIEALIRIADEQSRSLMSEREARLAIRAVFESVQGLVGGRGWRSHQCGDVAVQWRHQAPSVSYAPQTLRRYGSVRIRLPGDQSNPDHQSHQRANGASRSSAKVARTH